MRRTRLPLLAIGAFGLLLQCEPRNVELADLTGTDVDGGNANPLGKPCRDLNDCATSEYCDKASCGEPFGRCTRRPTFCAPDLDPVCGCNQVTYWNDCIRRQNGVGILERGECRRGAACSQRGDTECPTADAKCARVQSGPGVCSPELTGTCWVIPNCPPPDRKDVSGGAWDECKAGPGDGLRCQSLCNAIATEKAFRRAPPNCP